MIEKLLDEPYWLGLKEMLEIGFQGGYSESYLTEDPKDLLYRIECFIWNEPVEDRQFPILTKKATESFQYSTGVEFWNAETTYHYCLKNMKDLKKQVISKILEELYDLFLSERTNPKDSTSDSYIEIKDYLKDVKDIDILFSMLYRVKIYLSSVKPLDPEVTLKDLFESKIKR